MKVAKFNASGIVWQPEPGRAHEWNGYLFDPIQGKTVHTARVFTELGCSGFWCPWFDGHPVKYDGKLRDSTRLGFIGTIKAIEDKLADINR